MVVVVVVVPYQSPVLVLQQDDQEKAGLSEDAASLVRHLVSCLLPVDLQQIQQHVHRVLYVIHRLDCLVILVEGDTLKEGR